MYPVSRLEPEPISEIRTPVAALPAETLGKGALVLADAKAASDFARFSLHCADIVPSSDLNLATLKPAVLSDAPSCVE